MVLTNDQIKIKKYVTIQIFASPDTVSYCYYSWVILVFDWKLITHHERQMENRPEMLFVEMGK